MKSQGMVSDECADYKTWVQTTSVQHCMKLSDVIMKTLEGKGATLPCNDVGDER